jgi:hypothetical protein
VPATATGRAPTSGSRAPTRCRAAWKDGTTTSFADEHDPNTFQIAKSTTDARSKQPVAVPISSAGSATLSVSAGVTLAVTTPSFSEGDIGKNIRILGPKPIPNPWRPPDTITNPNLGTFTIGLASATAVTYANWEGIAEALPTDSGQWTIDGYDRVGGSQDGNGSSHAIYVFAAREGRRDVKVIGCSFRNVRTVAVKASGSNGPISDIVVANCHFQNCGAAAIWGADDSCEHSSLSFVDNMLVDCTTNRPGWGEGATVGILGSRGVQIRGNTFHYTQNNIGAVDGRRVGADTAITVSRFKPGLSQPVEGVVVDANTFTCDPQQTSPDGLLHAVISAERVGQVAYWNTGGMLEIPGRREPHGPPTGPPNPPAPHEVTVTLTDPSALFTTQLVGRPITLVDSAGGNDGTFTVLSVPSRTTLTYITEAVWGATFAAGTYRISPDRAIAGEESSHHRGGTLRITNNTFNHICHLVITTTGCVSPEITGNSWAFGAVRSIGDVMPVIRRNTSSATNSDVAQIQLAVPAWPIVADNLSVNVNHFGTTSKARDMTIGNRKVVTDYPLLGTRGRARPTNGHEEFVVAFGYDHVDGDTLEVAGVTYTYKALASSGNEFNALRDDVLNRKRGLINLFAARPDYVCADYAEQFALPDTGTLHIRRKAASSDSDARALVLSSALNPTALVMLVNAEKGDTPACQSRGWGTPGALIGTPPVRAAPVADKTVIWSPLAGHTAVAGLAAANPTGRRILGGSYLQLRTAGDSGACAVMQTDRTDIPTSRGWLDGGGEFRWWLAS